MWRSEMSYSIIENFGVTWATNTVCKTFAAGKRCRFGKNCSFLHECSTQKIQVKTTPQSDAMLVEESSVNQSISETLQKHPKAPIMIDVRKKLPLDGITLDSVEQSEPTWQYYVWCRGSYCLSSAWDIVSLKVTRVKIMKTHRIVNLRENTSKFVT